MRRTDDQFSTVCIVDHTAKVLERVSYNSYGAPGGGITARPTSTETAPSTLTIC
jgi:hypothetical protein